MQSLIDIRTTSGIRLDLSDDTKIELNMGGVSLLDMKQRTTTYTNQFQLPRTPTNDDVFGFSAVTQSLVKPVVNVYITKGLVQLRGTIKVNQFDKNYKCVFSQPDPTYIEILKTTTIDTMFDDVSIDSYSDVNTFINDFTLGINYKPLFGDTTNIIASNVNNSGTICVALPYLIDTIETICGVNITGDLLSETLFTSSYLNIPSAYITKSGINYSIQTNSTITASDLIAEIAKYFFKSIEFTGNNIIFTDIITSNQVDINTLSIESKEIYSGLGLNNNINYTLNSAYVYSNTLGATFTSDGTDTKEFLKLNSYLPNVSSGRYLLNSDTQSNGKIVICQSELLAGAVNVSYIGDTVSVTGAYKMTFTDLSTIFESKLQSVFGNTFILNVSGWITPLQAQQIINYRVIISMPLNGRYWVETMAYDLISGESKLKLIKL